MNNTIPSVPRDWIYRVRDLLYEVANETGELGKEAECLGSFIPDILSAPSPAGVDGWDVAGDILEKLSAAQAIIDGLRGEVAAAEGKWRLLDKALTASVDSEIDLIDRATSAMQQRDQQAQRIAELEGLLRDFAYHTQRREMPTESSLAEWADRIDAALSTGPAK